MSDKMSCKILTFEEVYEKTRVMSEEVKSSGYRPTTVVGLARGGWIPARLMCDFLGTTDLVSLKVEHWLETGRTTDEALIKYPLEASMRGKNLLVVDDITDTGESLATSIEHLILLDPEEIRTAVMQYITTSRFKPDYYAEEVTDWYWFIYPWNWIEDTSTLIVRLMSDEDGEEWSSDSINSGLQEHFGIRWGPDRLRYILRIMGDRGQIETTYAENRLQYSLKSRRVIQL